MVQTPPPPHPQKNPGFQSSLAKRSIVFTVAPPSRTLAADPEVFEHHLGISGKFLFQPYCFHSFSRPFVKSAYQKIIFLFQPKYILWVLKRTVSFFEHPKHMLKLIGKKIFTILRSKTLFI